MLGMVPVRVRVDDVCFQILHVAGRNPSAPLTPRTRAKKKRQKTRRKQATHSLLVVMGQNAQKAKPLSGKVSRPGQDYYCVRILVSDQQWEDGSRVRRSNHNTVNTPADRGVGTHTSPPLQPWVTSEPATWSRAALSWPVVLVSCACEVLVRHHAHGPGRVLAPGCCQRLAGRFKVGRWRVCDGHQMVTMAVHRKSVPQDSMRTVVCSVTFANSSYGTVRVGTALSVRGQRQRQKQNHWTCS